MLFPRVKTYKEKNGYFQFSDEIAICFADEVSKSLITAANELIPFPLKATNQQNANIVLNCDPSVSNNYGYFKIDGASDKIIATFTSREGGRDALSVIGELIKVTNQIATINKVVIEDWPDLKFRSFMQDVGRKYVPMDQMKSQILLMAKARMNVLHFHFTEYTGFGVAFKAFPELKGAAVTNGMQYTEDDIRELVEYANSLAIDIIPEIDLPGHANAITNAYQNLLCKTTDGVKPNGWALCVGSEETYVFLEKLLTEVTKLFKSEYVHLGTDEISMRDLERDPTPVADWEKCSVCSAISKNETELFYHFLRRSYAILKKLNKKMIIWNDQVDISTSPDIPRDILIEFWRVAGPHRGPIEGCSMQRFLDEGFDVINAHYPDTYIDLYVEYDNLKNWNPRTATANDDNTKGKIIGADFCAWDVFKHFVQSVPVSTVFFADRFRNTTAADQGDVVVKAASEKLFGIEDFNVFNYTKKVIDLDEDLKIFKEDANLDEVKTTLQNHTPRDIAEDYIKTTYLSLVDKT